VPGAFGPFARALEEHYGLSREAVSFWDVHEMADREHSDVGDHIVVHFADTQDTQRRVEQAVQTSLDRWWAFFDGIQAAIG
jgi:pyrroloquinoline quinone (PQQ) biosynthesis protein C